MRNQLAAVIFAGLSAFAAGAEDHRPFQFRKQIDLGRAGDLEIVAVPLDSEVYAGTRDGFPDLRVVDDRVRSCRTCSSKPGRNAPINSENRA